MGIMTIKAQIEIADDVFRANGVFNISPSLGTEGIQLSAALCLEKSNSLLASQAASLHALYAQVVSRNSRYSGWLIMTNGGMVQRTRLVQYYGLWKSIEKKYITLPAGRKTKEYTQGNDNEVQLFGGIQLHEPAMLEVASFLRSRPSTHLLLSKDDESIIHLLENGWRCPPHRFPLDILRYLQATGSILVATVGEFDDPQGGAVALSKPEIIQGLFAAY
ncbi:MAG: hypothetical protein ACN6OX_12145 [Pseudomonas sp.]